MDVLEMGQLDESNGWKVMVFFKMENLIFKKETDLAISPITGSPMSFLWFPLVDSSIEFTRCFIHDSLLGKDPS